uniref:Tb-292_membrane_associated_protein-like_protein/G eneDB:LmjF.15.0440 n=1 Tax=Leishmania donovani TaxID=5661 RepID=A0A6J8FBA4_LEIDO|nr:tb-292_membrane_associated_protein-like_protein/GeneDB:LmjF.15.0440 [Leishmania donovani]
MRARASELVAEHARDEEALRERLPFVGALPGGVTLRELDMANDPDVKPLLAQLEELAKDPAAAKGPEARRLEKAIGELARRAAEDEAERTRHGLVDAEGLHERFPFLPEEPVPGVSLVEARVMDDPEFRTLANELVDLRRGAEASPQALRAAEEALAGHAAEVAAAKLRATEEAQAHYPFLSKRVAGVPLSELPLAQDELFQALVAQRAPLLGSPRTNAARLHAVEARAHDRARELADAKRKLDSLRDAADDEVRSRNPFLPHSDVRGVPLRELGLSRDPEYARLMDRRLTLKERPVENAAELTAVEARLKKRATEVAEAKLVAEAELRAKYPTVATAPEAAMLSSLGLSLDPRLAQLEQQCVALADQPKPDRAVLRAAEEAAAVRVQELVDEDASAEEEAAQARAAVLKRYPMCARDVTEAVGKDAVFASLAARHAGLLSDPAANREPLADVEDLMRQRGAEVESGRRQRRRRRPANPPRLLDMNDVALESGELGDYHSRRHRHRRGRILDAREVPMDIAGEVREQETDTVPLLSGTEVRDPYYQALVALRASLVREDEAVNADSIRCVEEQMKDRVAQLNSDAARARAAEMRAEAALKARYPFLGPTVAGELLTAVRLEDDAVFVGLAAEHASLKATPTTPRQALACVEQGMRARASELVAEHARDEEALRERLPFVGALPGGVTLRELDMANDPDVKPLLAQLEELAKDPAAAKGPEARRLEKAIGELARRAAEDEAERTRHGLVDAEGLHERFPFLPEEPVPGVSLVEARVMDDPEFRTLANELVDLRRGAEASPQALRAAEEALAGHAAEVAAAKLRATEEAQAHYPFLSKRVAGVPLSELPLAQDELFQALVAQRAPLLGSPRTNAARLHAVEARAHDRARELADAKRKLDSLRDAADDEVRSRNPFLPHSDVRGVPLRELGLSRDPEYARLMDRRLTLKERPVENAAELTAVEARLKKRATEVAEAKLVAEAELRAKYPTVATAPEAAMLSSLGLSLDPRLAQLEQQCVALADQPKPDRAVLRAAEEAAAVRVQELVDEDASAEEEAAQARAAVLKRYPMCARDVTEAVGKDAVFASLAARHAGLLSDPAANREPLADVEDLMRQRGAEVESGRRQRRRRRPANPPRLLDMNDVALESGELGDYHSRRHRHRRGRILDAREVPMDIAGEVREQETDTVPLLSGTEVRDPYYQALVALRASLVREDEAVNADSIRCVEEQMKDRVAQLNSDAARARAAEMRAEAALKARYPFLGPTVAGELLTAVRLEDDAVFVGLAAEHASLKATPTTPRQALACVEQGMRARASELVAEHARDEEALRERLPFVGALPGGVTLRELDMANDPDVKPLLAQLEELAKDPAAAKGPEARRLEKAIGELARRAAEDEAERTRHGLVDAEGLHERFPFLPEEPVPGVSLVEARVMDDPEFRTLANELVDLRRGAEASPQALRAAEEALAGHAAEVAAAKLRATEEAQAHYPFLSKRVAGVPLSELPLAQDELFQALVAQRAPLLGSPRTNAARLHAVEARAHDRARELADAKRKLDSLRDAADDEVRSRNPFLPHSDVRGVPLRELGLSRDPEYARLMDRRLTLKERPVENAAELTAVEARLKKRATEVAEAKLVAEAELRAKYPTVATAPEAAMLSSLGLSLDPRLAQLEQQCVALADQPKPDRAVLRAAEEAAAVRVQELVDEDASAEEEAAQARAAVLKRYPMCARDVTEAVGKDAVFASLAARHAGLLSDPAANREPLADVEDLMRQRGAEVESGRRQRRRRRPANPPRLLDMNDVALESGELGDYHSRRHRHRRGRILDAREVPMDIAGEVREQETDTVPLLSGTEVRDPYYQALVALRASLVREDEAVNADSIRCVEEQMKDRVAQLNSDAARARAAEMRAEAALKARYPFLGPTVAGELLTAVRLEDDAVFVGLAAEHASLKATPTTPRQALACVEQGMRARASELVAEHARDEEALRERLPFVGALPGGVTLRELDMANDPDVKPLLAQLEELAKDPAAAKGPEARRLEKAIGELARRAAEDEAERTRHGLVDAEGLHERFPFLPEEPVPGVSLVEARVMDDPEFRTLANELVDLRRGAEASPQALRAAEEALAGHAAEVAAAKLRATEEAQAHYPFLSKRVAGVPLSELPLAQDELFQALVAQRAPLLGSPRTNAARLHAVEARAHDRARELADAKRKLDSLRDAADDEVRSRNPFLPHSDVRGVPLRELGLSRDPEYARLMDRRLTLKERPVENAAELTAVEARLKKRATEVAEAKLVAEAELRAKYPTVATAPEAAMLSSLGLSLDPRLAQLEQQCVALADQPKPDRAVLRAAEEAAAVRVQELVDEDASAEEEAAQARAAVLKRYPMCARDVTEAVGKDAVFASLAARHAGLLSDPAANREPLADVEDLMRQRGAEVESGRRQRRRRRPANPPRLLDMNDVALESGELGDYHSRRHRHRRGRILDAREVPMDIAGEVREQETDTVPLLSGTEVRDPYYQALVALRASLVREDEAVNADSIRCVEEQMKDRVAQLNSDAARARAAEMRAEAALKARYPFLGPTVAGELLTAVRLEDDAVFVGLAAEHASLKATPTTPRQALACVEQGMRARASELVAEHARDEEALRERLPFVGALPGGVTLRELDMANDPDVKPLLAQLEELAKDPAAAKGPEARRLEKAIGELARRAAEDEAERTRHGLVDAEGLHERFPFLPEEPVPGVSLVEARVMDDPEFRTLANALVDLRRDSSVKETAEIVFQQSMAEVAIRLASDKLRATEEAQAHYPFLSKRVAGVPLSELPLAQDELFQALVAQRAPLLGSPRTNAARLHAVEARAHDRARELAVETKAIQLFRMDESDAVRARHPYLPHSDILLVPLREIAVHSDRKLQRLGRRRLQLKGAGSVDVSALALVESEMRERVGELAGRIVAAEMKGRRRFLPRQRRSVGVVFAALHIPEDEEIVEWRLDVMENPDCDADDEAVAKKAIRRRGSALLDAYLEAEADIARELHQLRRRFPTCVRDVNPSIELDDYFATLRGAYADWVAFMDEEEPSLIQIQEEMRARSVALIGDDRCVADALNNYCVAEAELRLAKAHRKPSSQVARLRRATDVAQSKHRLWSRRQARRHVTAPLFDFPVNEGDFIDDDDADSWVEEDTYAAHSRAAHAKACMDSHFLYLQRQKATLTAGGHRSGARCVSELLKRRLRQLTGDAARLQRSRKRRDNAILRQYPFLQSRYFMSVPLSELRLDEDDEFMRLAAERDRLLQPPSDLRARYPFLPAVINGVPIEELGLEADPEFMRLASQREDLIGPLRAKLKSVKDREEAMRIRVIEHVAAHVARENHLRDTYPFLDAQKLPLHLQRLYLEHDVQFQRLYAEYARLRGSAAGDDASMTTATIATPKAGRCSRVSSIASSSSLASPRPHAKTVAQKQLEKRMREWVMRLAEEEAEWEFANMMDLESLADRFPFLPVEPLPGIHLGEIDAFVDVRFCSMAAELELARKNIAPPAVVATAEAALLSRVMQLAEEKHMKTVRCRQRHPPLPRRVVGVLIGDIDLPVCGEFAEASEEALLESYYKAAGKVKARRICNADEDEAVRSRHPFLEMNDVHGVPLRYLPLSDDSIYLSYLRKWRAVLSAEPIDREKLRIYEDLLRECAEEQALRIIDVNAAMANRLSQLQVMNVVPAALPLLDLHNILVRARDVLVAEHKSGVIPPPTVEDLELLAGLATAFASAWEDVVQELTALRRRFPWSVRDVNPALQHDATFQQLEAQRQSLLATFNQMELMESLETEERKRSVELIEDDTYVRDAEKACAPSAQKPLRRLSAEELTKRWKHQLCLRHRQRRVVSFSDIPDDATELNGSSTSGGRISKARKSRERRKRSMSWTKLDVDVIPDNVFAEIKEEEFHTSLPCSTGPSDILTAPDGLPPMLLLSDRLQGSQLASQPHTPQKQQRRQRSQSGGRHRLGSITAESIPHSEACAMLGDGKIVPVDELASLNSGAAGPESSVASSAILRVGATPAPSMATTVASSSDAAGLSPRRGAADPRKGRKRVLKKRLRVRRASTASVDAIPDETPGEVVEHDLDEIGCVARQAVGPPCPDASEPSAGGANRQGSGGRHRIPQPPPQQRKTRTRQLPTKPKLAARSARTQASAATPKTRDAKSGRADLEPVVRAKSRKLSVPRMGSQLLSVAGEEPEVTVGLLREQEIDQQQQTSRDTAAAAMASTRRPQLEQREQQQQQQRDQGTTSRTRSKSKQHLSRPASSQRSRISISQLEEEEIRELHISLEQQLQDPADRGRRRSAAPRRGTSAESKSRSRRASAAPRGSAPSSASFGPTNSLDAVSPEGSPEAAEKALVQRALREAQPFLAQAVTQEEVEAAAEPMRYVFEHCDLSRYAASGSGASALLSARLRELEALLQAWIVQRSKGAMQHRATAPANDQAARSCRRLQAADSSGSYENPRRLPLRWAHLTVEELDSDDGLRHLRDSAAPPQRIDSYLAAWSARKQAANEALFATFPFLATLPCGYALTEVGFTNDAEFQHYMRGGAYQESVHVQQQMRDVVDKLARTKAAAAEGRQATRYADRVRATVETTRDAAGPATGSTERQSGGDDRAPLQNAQALAEYPEDPQLLDAILAARVKRTNRFLDKRQRLSFVAQSKQESERLIKRMMVRMKKECTSDIPMGMEDVETLRFFFDGVDVDHFGVLDRTDTTDFIMLTLGEEKRMSRTDVERLLFPDVPRGAVLPTLVDFSDFSKFYKKVALQELLKQDSTFDKKVATRATTVPDAGAETSRATTITPRRPEPPSTSPRTGSDRRGRLSTVSSGVLPVRAFAATSSSAAASEAGTVAASANTPRRIGLRRPSSEPHPHHEGSGILHTLQHRHGSAYTPPTSARDRIRVPEGGAVASTDRWFEYGQPSSGHVSAPAGTPPQAEK